jgi:hypothetical protein
MADFSAEERRRLAARGQAMPGGRFPIRNRADLENAIRAVGRAGGPGGTAADRNTVRRWIIRRARALGLTDMIPDTWNSDGTLRTGRGRLMR